MTEIEKANILGWARKNAHSASALLAVIAEVPEFAQAINDQAVGGGLTPPDVNSDSPEDNEAAEAGAGYGQEFIYSVTVGAKGQKTTQQERLDMLGLKRGAWTSFRPLAWFESNPTKFKGEAATVAKAIKAEKGSGAFIGIGQTR